MKINRVSLTAKGGAVSSSAKNGIANNRILVFDKKGEMTFTTELEGGLVDMEYYDGYVFVNQSNSVVRMNVKDGKRTTVRTNDSGTDIIVYDSGNILLCYRTKATYIEM